MSENLLKKIIDRRTPHFQSQHFNQEQHFRRQKNQKNQGVRLANGKPTEKADKAEKRQDYLGYTFDTYPVFHDSEIIKLPIDDDRPRIIRVRGRPPQRNRNREIFFEPSYPQSRPPNNRQRPRPNSFRPPRPIPPPTSKPKPPSSEFRYQRQPENQRGFQPFIPPYSGFEVPRRRPRPSHRPPPRPTNPQPQRPRSRPTPSTNLARPPTIKYETDDPFSRIPEATPPKSWKDLISDQIAAQSTTPIPPTIYRRPPIRTTERPKLRITENFHTYHDNNRQARPPPRGTRPVSRPNNQNRGPKQGIIPTRQPKNRPVVTRKVVVPSRPQVTEINGREVIPARPRGLQVHQPKIEIVEHRTPTPPQTPPPAAHGEELQRLPPRIYYSYDDIRKKKRKHNTNDQSSYR